MGWIVTLLIVVQVICASAIIILVLLQHGKGADMGAAFGSGASGSLFGASGSANFLSRSTAVVAAVFFAVTIGLAYSATTFRVARGGGLMSTAVHPAPAGSGAAPEAPAGSGAAPAAPAGGGAAPASQQIPQDSNPATPAPKSSGPSGTDKSAAIPK